MKKIFGHLLWISLTIIYFIVLFSNAKADKQPFRTMSLSGITGTPTSFSFLPVVQNLQPTKTPTTTPTSTPTQTPTRTATPTATATQPPLTTGLLDITYIFYDGVQGSSEPDEYVQIENKDSRAIQIQNWTLRDDQSHIFTFPSFVITPGQVCRVYTNEYHPDSCGFSYGNGAAIWNNTGDCGYLRDSGGTQIDSYCY
jgi:hypothetical protein